jgi:hypothetical protein
MASGLGASKTLWVKSYQPAVRNYIYKGEDVILRNLKLGAFLEFLRTVPGRACVCGVSKPHGDVGGVVTLDFVDFVLPT